MLTLTEQELDWIREQIPNAPRSPLGGRPPAEKRKVVAGIFWILDNGAKWKDLPRRLGSKSRVHRWFKKWVEAGISETLGRAAGRLVEQRGEYRLYECFLDATFSRAKGDGVACTKSDRCSTLCCPLRSRNGSAATRPTTATPWTQRCCNGASR